MQTETLVVIRAFRTIAEADAAQVALMTAGIYGLIYSDDSVALPPGESIMLAVHQRDVGLAESALSVQASLT